MDPDSFYRIGDTLFYKNTALLSGHPGCLETITIVVHKYFKHTIQTLKNKNTFEIINCKHQLHQKKNLCP